MTGRELLDALQALPAEHLDRKVILYASDEPGELDDVGLYEDFLKRNPDVEDPFTKESFLHLTVIALST